MSSAHLGPFELLEPLASGAMGVVWRALHRAQDLPVAVKVMSSRYATTPEFVASFRDEVRAVAALDHPGVVVVLDYGDLPEGLGPELKAGSPYLVMELASGGSLADAPNRPTRWNALASVLLRLLDALAHAHARGVIHRDLKPQNVLVGGPDDLRPGLHVTDFGLARLAGGAVRLERAGTPRYMAPEQIMGLWRAFGPPTDLYALGGMAWHFATGRPVFAGRKGGSLTKAQLSAEPGAFAPTMPVPQGFEHWVRRLLEKDPRDRFACAADAAWSLRQLDGALAAAAEPSGRFDPDAPTRIATRGSTPTAVPGTPAIPGADGPARPWSPTEQAPLPSSWRPPAVQPPPPRLIGAGLGLFALRPVPLVGREGERDLLWSSLREASVHGRPRVVHLTGSLGLGRTRLLEWLAHRAAETGAADVLMLRHASEHTGTRALARCVEAALAARALDDDEVLEHVVDELVAEQARDPGETELWARRTEGLARGLAAVLRPTSEHAGDAVRHGAFADLVARRGRRRPVAVLVDDAQWGADALRAVQVLLERPGRLPLLVVVATRDDALEGREERALLEAVTAAAPARVCALSPLDGHAQRTLLSRMLGLDAATADRILGRSEGNPQYAVQLVGEWVRRDLLRPAPHGFTLAPGADVELPRDLHLVWRERLGPVLQRHPRTARRWLERAAVLDEPLHPAVWTALCADLGGDEAQRSAVAEALATEGLAERTAAGWSLRYRTLRESLVRSAKRSGRLEAHHRACAQLLEARPGADPQRLGAHLMGAGAPERALDVLYAALHHVPRPPPRWRLAVARAAEGARVAAGVPDADERTGRIAYGRLMALYSLYYFAEAAEVAEGLAAAAARHRWGQLHAQALLRRGFVSQVQRELDDALDWYARARAAAKRCGDRALQGSALRNSADVVQLQGDLHRAGRIRLTARRMLEEAGDEDGVVRAIAGAASQALHSGRLDEAEALCREAIERSRDVPTVPDAHRASWVLLQAEVARARGDFDTAVRRNVRAIDMRERYGARFGMGHLNVALARLAQGDAARARVSAQIALEAMQTNGPHSYVGAVHVVAAGCAAAAGTWELFDLHLQRAREGVHAHRLYDPDSAWPLERAASEAERAGEPRRAKAAWQLAAEVWERAGRSKEAARARRRAEAP